MIAPAVLAALAVAAVAVAIASPVVGPPVLPALPALPALVSVGAPSAGQAVSNNTPSAIQGFTRFIASLYLANRPGCVGRSRRG